ncbi:MAG: bacillithiol biosynthesis cysteine-adding enzyme BshC [Cyclobacteriaceae bacterium]|nr:bacillithiol biosynthesis cysteine-adding enzyme BshC [Cyclobacteriaceae bacterium]
MNVTKTTLRETGAFSQMFLDYLEQNPKLRDFYAYQPDMEGLGALIRERKLSMENRVVLTEVLQEQYGPLTKTDRVLNNILSLSADNTFTVTTGHQLNIFTGPLYFIFKIVTTINLAQRLKEAFPDYHFVPVYWMASEDHDFEEINHFHLFGKKYTWETAQNGPVGRFATQSLNVVLEQLPESIDLFERAYLDSSSLADAVRYYINELFGDQGLVVLDADHRRLKTLFAPVIKSDVAEQVANGIVTSTNEALSEAGYKSQAFARKINFFYLNGYRERIVEENGRFSVNNKDLVFTKEELLAAIDREPEHFSPNVIMRPVYQETILPNIAYIGGPAEMVYWMQLKGVFAHYQVSFPVLLPRNFGMVINKATAKKVEKLGLELQQYFRDNHEIKAEYLRRHIGDEHVLDDDMAALAQLFEQVKAKAISIDKSLEGFIGAETAKALKGMEAIGKRLKKAQETQNETAMAQIDGLRAKLFPGGGLQERHENFLNFHLNNPSFLPGLFQHFDPLDFTFYQFWED